jgi:MFS family permease
MGVSVGAGIAFLLGGQVIGFVSTSPPLTLPVVGELYAWQTVFLVVGLPGLVIAALMQTVREPKRRGMITVDNAAAGQISLGDAARFLAKRRRTYGGLAAIVAGTTILGYGFLNWIPTMFARTWGLAMPQIATDLGWVLLIAGPIGVNGGGWLADRWFRQGHKDAHLRVMMLSAPVMLLASAALPLMPTPALALVMFVPHILGAAAITAVGGAALMIITPNQLRAQATAIYYFIISLAGLTLGPTSVAVLTDYVFGDEAALRYSMAIVGFAAPMLSVVGALWIRKAYLQSMDEADGWSR